MSYQLDPTLKVAPPQLPTKRGESDLCAAIGEIPEAAVRLTLLVGLAVLVVGVVESVWKKLKG